MLKCIWQWNKLEEYYIITLEEQDNVDFNLISKPPIRNFYAFKKIIVSHFSRRD